MVDVRVLGNTGLSVFNVVNMLFNSCILLAVSYQF